MRWGRRGRSSGEPRTTGHTFAYECPGFLAVDDEMIAVVLAASSTTRRSDPASGSLRSPGTRCLASEHPLHVGTFLLWRPMRND